MKMHKDPGFAARMVRGAVIACALRPGLVVLVYLGLIAGSVYAALGLGVDTDSSKMLNPDLPFQRQALELRRAFPQDKTAVLVLVRAPDGDQADRVVATLAADLAGRPGVAGVFAPSVDPFFLRNGLLYQTPEAFEQQIGRISSSANLIAGLAADRSLGGFLTRLDQARQLAEGGGRAADLDPIYAETAMVVSAALDGRDRPFRWTAAFTGQEGPALRVLTVTPELDFTALNPAKPALRAIDAALAAQILPVGVDIGVTGDPALRAEELRSVTAKIGWSLGASLVLVAVVLWLALGRFGRVALGLAALLSTLVLTTGFAAVAVGSLNLISVAFIVLMVGLGIDFAIHFLAHLGDQPPGDAPAALEATGATIGPALMLTAASTALAFLAFTVTDFVGMAQLGLIGAAGVVIAFAVSVTLLPALVALGPALAPGAPRGRGPAALAAGRGGRIAVALLGALACVAAFGARFDADPMNLRDPEAVSVTSFNWLAEEAGRSPFRAALLAPTAEEARAMADRLAALPEVESTVWLGDLIPAEQDRKLALLDLAWPSLDFAVNGTPEDLVEAVPVTPSEFADSLPPGSPLAAPLRALAGDATAQSTAEAALFANFGLLTERLAAMLEMDEVTADSLPPPLARRYLSTEGLYRIDILPAADIRDPDARADFVEAVQSVAADATGAPVQIEGASRAVTDAMLLAVAIALCGAALLSLAALRSIIGMLAILIPVILAGAICMAASAVLGIPFNYANVIVLPLIIGIGVDSGIHLAMRTRQVGEVFETSTPMAAFYSALTTIAAFGTLALSDHWGTASMGILLAIGLAATVLTTFTLTPPLARLSHTET